MGFTTKGSPPAKPAGATAVDHGKLLRNAVERATNKTPPVTVDGAGVLDVTVWRQDGSMTVTW